MRLIDVDLHDDQGDPFGPGTYDEIDRPTIVSLLSRCPLRRLRQQQASGLTTACLRQFVWYRALLNAWVQDSYDEQRKTISWPDGMDRSGVSH